MSNSVPRHHHPSFVVCCDWTTLSKPEQNHRCRKNTEGPPKHKIGSAPWHGTMIFLVLSDLGALDNISSNHGVRKTRKWNP